MNAEIAKLTTEQSEDWEYYVRWYLSNGWEGDEARELAWRDLSKKYPELSGASRPS